MGAEVGTDLSASFGTVNAIWRGLMEVIYTDVFFNDENHVFK